MVFLLCLLFLVLQSLVDETPINHAICHVYYAGSQLSCFVLQMMFDLKKMIQYFMVLTIIKLVDICYRGDHTCVHVIVGKHYPAHRVDSNFCRGAVHVVIGLLDLMVRGLWPCCLWPCSISWDRGLDPRFFRDRSNWCRDPWLATTWPKICEDTDNN